MERARQYCERLLSHDFQQHADAYRYLTECEPFMRAFERLRFKDLNFFDVASLIVRGGRNRRGREAFRVIEAEFENAERVAQRCAAEREPL